MTIEEFCDLHEACDEGREWALANCQTMQDVWDKASTDWLIWVATREGVVSGSELRKFACFCVRQVWHLLSDEHSKNAVIVAERHADGIATDGELAAARDAAWDAARDEARDAAWYAAWYAASAAARAAAWDAARDAAWDAARYAAWAAAWDEARYAAWDEARDAQAKWLRENAKPCFERRG